MLARNLRFLIFILVMFNDACFSKEGELFIIFDEWPDSLMNLSLSLTHKTGTKKDIEREYSIKGSSKSEITCKKKIDDFKLYNLITYYIRSKYKLPQTGKVSISNVPSLDKLIEIHMSFSAIEGKNPKKDHSPWYDLSLKYVYDSPKNK